MSTSELANLRSLILCAAAFSIAACGSSSDSDAVPAATVTQPPPPPAGGSTTNSSPAIETPAPPPAPFDPLKQITSGEDITVESVELVSERTFDVFVSTPNVSPNVKMRGKNAIRVTLPAGYSSGKRYPVIYFLHGATCDYTTLYTSMKIEEKTTGATGDVIIVQPEGGQFGFYTDWVDQSPVQKWTTYHLTQMIPFIDRNLRTIAAKEGRAVMGISMGGLGAMRYATERPELFAAVASFSGAVDLQHLALQAGFTAMLMNARLNPAGPFGDVFSPVWAQKNPVRHAAKLATVKTFIYVGSGSDDIAEQATTSASYVLSKVLGDAKIEHFVEDYGVPGQTPEGFCNGGHTLECNRYAFVDALPRLLEVLADPR